MPDPIDSSTCTDSYVPEARDRYLRIREHGRGGTAVVWLARDNELGRQVAFKEIRPDRRDSGVILSRFIKEARVTSQLEHPGIAPVYELARQRDDQQPFYTMRFVEGRTLHGAIQEYHQQRLGDPTGQARPLEFPNLLNAFISICYTVAYAHARGVLHRDLKPHNVMLGSFKEVVVLDWGLAKVLGEPEEKRETRTASPVAQTSGLADTEPATPIVLGTTPAEDRTVLGEFLGTPAYAAPEQASGQVALLNPRTDVYGLGAILYEILTGGPPFPKATTTDRSEVLRQVREEAPFPPRQHWRDVPHALEAICLKAFLCRGQTTR